MYQIDFNNPVHVFFSGIGGISMSGLARILQSRGFKVSGSDRESSAITRGLTENGIPVMIGQKKENITKDIDLVVFTAAIHPDNPEYIEGVKFLSQKDTQYKNSPLFEKVLVYNYNLDRNYFTVNSKLESKTIIDQYKKDLEKKYNLLFNDDKRYGENAAICECKLKGAASMYILVCEGDFDVGNNADFSVVLCTPKEDKGFSDEEFDAYKDEPGANSKNFVGFWKSLFYLFDNGSTSNTDMYSIFTYNTGSASLYVNYEKYAGTWKEDNDFYTFTFGDLKGEGKMETVNGKEYLVIDFDGVRGRVAFEMVY